MKALVIGGTGPTGPFIVEGLLDRGFGVTIYHRGTHEVEFTRPVKHIHGDPFNKADLEHDLASLRFDAVVSNYGRLRLIARVLAGRCDRFIGITGGPVYLGWENPDHNPNGLPVPVSVDAPVYSDRNQDRFGALIAEGERLIREEEAKGSYRATLLRYPAVYGPRQPTCNIWPIVKRILDGRKHIIVPGDGLQLRARGYADNCAHIVMLALDNHKAAGRSYNVADEKTYSLKDFIGLVTKGLGANIEAISIAHPLAFNLAQGYAGPPYHLMFDMSLTIHELGYRDLVPTPEAVKRNAQWLVSSLRIVDGKAIRASEVARDQYAYDLEDKLIDAYQKAMTHITEVLPPAPPIKSSGYSYRIDTRGTEGTPKT